jgi:hypothetical protein
MSANGGPGTFLKIFTMRTGGLAGSMRTGGLTQYVFFFFVMVVRTGGLAQYVFLMFVFLFGHGCANGGPGGAWLCANGGPDSVRTGGLALRERGAWYM